MSDLRPDDNTISDSSERTGLPPDLLPLHHRLTDDGERWRWRAPDGAGLADWARATLAHAAAPRADVAHTAAQPRLRERRLESLDAEITPSPGPKGPIRDMTMTRIRGFIGVAAAVLVVGLIALLLTHNAANRGRTGAGGDATPVASPTITLAAPSNVQMAQPDQLPVVAQSDPSVVYKIANGALLRSSDGGKTYASLALPKTDLSQIDSTSLAVSPLDPTRVFVTMGGKKSGQGCLPPNNPYPTIATHGGVMASGYVPCASQYISVDGGHTWSQPRLPTSGVLGGLNMMRAVQGAYGDQSYAFQTQGQRLYSAMAFDNMSGSLVDSPGVRLVASDDGGLTWRFIDTSLATSNRYICDFGASPIPSVVYAVTGDQACGGMTYPNLSLWRSDNDGQTWTRVRSLPTLAETGPAIGGHGELYLFMPQVTVQGHGASTTSAPADVKLSGDGGATFISAPSAGLPANPLMVGPYATLADGAVVFGVAPGNAAGPGPSSLYTWQKGQSAWTKIGHDIPAGIAAVTVSSLPAGATQQTITIVDNAGNVLTETAPLG
jgi:hypothetical protein